MLSSTFGDQEPVLNLNRLFDKNIVTEELKEKVEELQMKDVGVELITI